MSNKFKLNSTFFFIIKIGIKSVLSLFDFDLDIDNSCLHVTDKTAHDYNGSAGPSSKSVNEDTDENQDKDSNDEDKSVHLPINSLYRGPVIIVTDTDNVSRDYNDPLDKGKQKMPSDYDIKEAVKQTEESNTTLIKMGMNMERLTEINEECERSSASMSRKELARKFDNSYWDVTNEIGEDIEKLSKLKNLKSDNEVIQDLVFNPLKRKLDDIEKDFETNQKRFMDKMPDIDTYESMFETDSEGESDTNSK